MSDLHVELSQIDRSDLSAIKNILQSGFNILIDTNSDFKGNNLHDWYSDIVDNKSNLFAIRVSKADSSHATRSWLVGVCGITDIDWISRHGKIVFIMVDKDGHKSTLQGHPASQHAFKKLTEYAFKELNLNKVWISVLNTNDISKVLDSCGFSADGIRRQSIFFNGKFRDEAIFSITLKEYIERNK